MVASATRHQRLYRPRCGMGTSDRRYPEAVEAKRAYEQSPDAHESSQAKPPGCVGREQLPPPDDTSVQYS